MAQRLVKLRTLQGHHRMTMVHIIIQICITSLAFLLTNYVGEYAQVVMLMLYLLEAMVAVITGAYIRLSHTTALLKLGVGQWSVPITAVLDDAERG